jgi:hypothetical protein
MYVKPFSTPVFLTTEMEIGECYHEKEQADDE